MKKSFKFGLGITIIAMVLGVIIYMFNSQYNLKSIQLVNALEIGSIALIVVVMWTCILLVNSKEKDKFNRGILGDYIDMLNENIITEKEFIAFCNEIRWTALDVNKSNNTKTFS